MKQKFNFKILETERLELRELSPRVYDYLFTNYSDAYIRKFLGLETKEDFLQEKSKYENGLQMFNKSYYIFHMIEKASETLIGTIGYHTWYVRHDRAEIFYNIRQEQHRRKGYATEALWPVIRFGFEDMKLHRIEAMLSAKNTASVKLVERAGFSKEGVLKEHYLVGNVYEDSDIYGLLKDTYQGENK